MFVFPQDLLSGSHLGQTDTEALDAGAPRHLGSQQPNPLTYTAINTAINESTIMYA